MPPHVINATGVILHTNLGRAPWPRAARRRRGRRRPLVRLPGARRGDGRRGRRFHVAEEPPARADRRRGCAGREEQRGGPGPRGRAGRDGAAWPCPAASSSRSAAGSGSRRSSGGRARGSSRSARRTGRGRRTSRRPWPTAGRRLVLRVHPSNFVSAGSPRRPDPVGVAALAHAHGAIVVDDLGSGALLDTAAFGLAHEPMPARTAGGRRRPGHVQRRQAARRAAGRADRRPGRPRRAAATRSAGARGPARQGDARRRSPRRWSCTGPGAPRARSRSGG